MPNRAELSGSRAAEWQACLDEDTWAAGARRELSGAGSNEEIVGASDSPSFTMRGALLSIVGLGSTGHLELNYSGLDGATDDLKFRNRDGKFESTRARASWIDVEDPITLLYRWLVRVSRHNYLKPSSHGIEIQLGQIVQNVYEDILDLKNFGF